MEWLDIIGNHLNFYKLIFKLIYEIKEADIKDGGGGAFYIFLKNNLIKWNWS